MRHSTQVCGEPLDTLLQFLPYVKTSKGLGGLVRVTAEDVPNKVIAPFTRALMRMEAKLLRQDADQVDEGCAEPRTADERRADAFVELIMNMSAANNYIGNGSTREPGSN